MHTYGNVANYRPHLHVMVTAGAFTPDGLIHSPATANADHLMCKNVETGVRDQLSPRRRPPPSPPTDPRLGGKDKNGIDKWGQFGAGSK